MAKTKEFSIDTNVAFEMIDANVELQKYGEESFKEYNSRLTRRINYNKNKTIERIDITVKSFVEFKSSKTSDARWIADDAISEHEKLMKQLSKQKTDEDKEFFVKKLVDNFKKIKKNIFVDENEKKIYSNKIEEQKESIKIEIANVQNYIDRNRDFLGNVSNNEIDKKKISVYKEKQNDLQLLTLQLKNLEKINTLTTQSDKKFNRTYTRYVNSLQKKTARNLMLDLNNDKVKIKMSEYVYEEICNHIEEEHSINVTTDRPIETTKKREDVNNFTKKCKLTLVQDKTLTEFVENVAYELMTDLSPAEKLLYKQEYKKESRAEAFIYDENSLGKMGDCVIVALGCASGTNTVTFNLKHTIGATYIFNPTNGKVDIDDKKRRQIEAVILKHKNNAEQKFKLSNGMPITIYDIKNGKVSFNKTMANFVKCQTLNDEYLKKYAKRYNNKFKNAWVGNFESVEALKLEDEFSEDIKKFNEKVTPLRKKRVSKEKKNIKQQRNKQEEKKNVQVEPKKVTKKSPKKQVYDNSKTFNEMKTIGDGIKPNTEISAQQVTIQQTTTITVTQQVTVQEQQSKEK